MKEFVDITGINSYPFYVPVRSAYTCR